MIEKFFLGWDEPFLWLVEKHLRETSSQNVTFPGGLAKSTRIITPSKRSSRRLIELICARADEEKLPTLNLEISTLSDLPTLLNQERVKPIDRLESLLIWKEALSLTGISDLMLLSAQDPIFYLENLRNLLATVGYRPVDILAKIESEHAALDLSLWRNINKVWENYESLLAENNICDSANILFSLAKENQPINLEENLVLAGCHNMTQALINATKNICTDFKILINAPENHADGFNEIGVLNAEYWVRCLPTIDRDKIKLFDSDSEQTKWVSGELVTLRNLGFPQELISIVPLDSSIIGPLELAIEKAGYKAVLPGTKNLKNSSIGTLVLAVTEYFSQGENALNRIIEHPLILSFAKRELNLNNESVIINYLDEIQLLSTERSIRNHAVLPKKSADVLLKLKDLLFSIELKPITADHQLSFFIYKVIEVLKLVTDRENSSLYTYEEVEKLSSFLLKILENTNLANRIISAKDFNNFLKEILYKEELSSEHADGLEVIGWLEAQLDDSQACFILSCNENYLPQKTSLDPLLPNSFKDSIGLPSRKINDALTSFAIHTLINSKKIIKFGAPKITFSGDLTKISKFIALGTTEPLSNLIQKFYGANKSTQSEHKPIKVAANLIKPINPEVFPLKNLSPTKIKAYLHCPYSFYLQYVLAAEIVEYQPLELTPLVFGSILHSLFEQIGKSETKFNSKDEFNHFAEKIFDQTFGKYLGVDPSITLQIQKSLLWSKFENFKTWHLNSIADGWEILACEYNIFDDTTFVLNNGKIVPFKGKLDRLEYHPDLKEVRCIDFKTGNNAYGFKQAFTKEGWKDPQIPLYVKLLQHKKSEFKELIETNEVRMIYVSFPKNGDLNINDKVYDQDIGENVLSLVQTVAQLIQDGLFWPPKNLDLYIERIFGQMPQDISTNEIDYESEFDEQESY